MDRELNHGSIYMEDCVKRLREATTLRDLEKAAHVLDDPQFLALPETAQMDLSVIYSQRFFQLSDALS